LRQELTGSAAALDGAQTRITEGEQALAISVAAASTRQEQHLQQALETARHDTSPPNWTSCAPTVHWRRNGSKPPKPGRCWKSSASGGRPPACSTAGSRKGGAPARTSPRTRQS
jgi:hypothetical protein